MTHKWRILQYLPTPDQPTATVINRETQEQGHANAQLSFFSSVAAYDSAGFNSTERLGPLLSRLVNCLHRQVARNPWDQETGWDQSS